MAEASQDQNADDSALDERLGGILNALEERIAGGENVSEAAVRAEYPEYADQLLPALARLREIGRLEGIRPSTDSVANLVERGLLTPSSDPAYAAELGPYRVRRLIGSGGMGIVLEAHEDALDRTVALKIIRPELVRDGAAFVRFEREAKATAALQNPNVVTVHAVGEHGGTHFLSMEYIRGSSLSGLIRQHGPLPMATIRHIFRRILFGLVAVHEANLVHRDIKSSNVLIGDYNLVEYERQHAACKPAHDAEADPLPSPGSGDAGPDFAVKIADFGLARLDSAQATLTGKGCVPGTPEYMSPEQTRTGDKIGHRTDLYSAGVVLYEMLAGRTPFKAESPSTVGYRIVHEDPADPRALNAAAAPDLSSLALRLLAKRPEDRFETAAEAISALDRGTRVHLPRTRRRMLRWCAGLVIVMATAGGWAMLGGETSPTVSDVTPPIITGVTVREDIDGNRTRTLLVDYADGRSRVPFVTLPGVVGRINAAAVVDQDGHPDNGDELVVAALNNPRNRNAFVWYDAAGTHVWQQDMTPRDHVKLATWPDVDNAEATLPWSGRWLATGNLDGVPGDEVVLGANHQGTPARVTVCAPRGDDLIATFWHHGHLSHATIVEDFLGPGRPAIVAWGQNNELDRPMAPPTDPRGAAWPLGTPLTVYDLVLILMVLDPAQMNGIGPPRMAELAHLDGDPPYAYAFLNHAYQLRESEDGTGLGWAEVEEVSAHDGSGETWLRLVFNVTGKVGTDEKPIGGRGFEFFVDKDLKIRGKVSVYNERVFKTRWREAWTPIIQEGQWLRPGEHGG